MSKPTSSPLGLVLGSGGLPAHLIHLCKQENKPFVIVAIKGQTDPSLVKNEEHLWMSLGEIEDPLEYLKEQGVKDLIFAGAINRPSLRDLALDKKAAKWIATIGLKALGDDGLLSGILSLIEKEGFRVIGVQNFLKNLQVAPGLLGDYKPTDLEFSDIDRGIDVLNTLGPLDIGQSVIVEEGVVLSIEAAEGTDELIKRTKQLQKAKSGILVKIPKPNQSHLIDLPTIGLKTIQSAKNSGLCGIAIGAHSTIVLDRDKLIEAANKARIFLIAIDLKRTS
jgi:DUF1009 family protein